VWKAGFWTAVQPGFVWIPARYYWTPSGYVFVDGYWDRPLEDRGVIFAPVVFVGTPWDQAGWGDTPRYVVSAPAIFDCMFYRPRCGHYFFGNYYAPGCSTLGFRPWYSGLGRYDPMMSYYAWQHRSTPNWFAGHQKLYQARLQGSAGL